MYIDYSSDIANNKKVLLDTFPLSLIHPAARLHL